MGSGGVAPRSTDLVTGYVIGQFHAPTAFIAAARCVRNWLGYRFFLDVIVEREILLRLSRIESELSNPYPMTLHGPYTAHPRFTHYTYFYLIRNM